MRAYGSVSLARSYAALLAFFLMGAAAIAIGLFMSSLTENQIIAAVCTFGSLFVFVSDAQHRGADFGSAAAWLYFTVLAALLALFLHWMTKAESCPAPCFVCWRAAWPPFISSSPRGWRVCSRSFSTALALFGRFDNFVNGLFDISSLVYFVSVALLFVFFHLPGFENAAGREKGGANDGDNKRPQENERTVRDALHSRAFKNGAYA